MRDPITTRRVRQAEPQTHPRTLGWFGTAALAMGGSNQSLFLISALFVGQGAISGQGSAAVPLLLIGLLLSIAAAPGWLELVLMFPNRVGGIAATCAEAFRPYSPVLANLTGVCYWWGWVPTCGLTALLSASAIHVWFVPGVQIEVLATGLVLLFTIVNLAGVTWAVRLAMPIAVISGLLAFVSAICPLLSGEVDWRQATDFHLTTPFSGWFGDLTSLMAGLYLIGFAAPAFEAVTCHVGETVDPAKNLPRAMIASIVMAILFFAVLPIVWLGALGPEALGKDLAVVLGPTFAPWFGSAAKGIAMAFMIFSMFHGTLQPLAGAARTLSQLADDGLLPEFFSKRMRTDAPVVATLLTAGMSILFLLMGDPIWLVAAANFTYLIGICLPSVAVWLMRRDEPELRRPYRAPRLTITLGLCASIVWGISAILGFQQFGLPTVLVGLAFAYSGSALYAWRRAMDRRRAGLPWIVRSLHVKLTGAMLAVLLLDGAGYLIAVRNVATGQMALTTALEDIFVLVALLTISVGLVLPGMIAHAAIEVSWAARGLATGTLADFSRAMEALGNGNLEQAHARVDIRPVAVTSRDEVGDMAESFNALQHEVAKAATGLDQAREGLLKARRSLLERAEDLNRAIADRDQEISVRMRAEEDLRLARDELEERVAERTKALRLAQSELLTSAHRAGMAEIATNVLHNVGNVLNSVNISISTAQKTVRESHLRHLTSVVGLLKEHREDLADFLTRDEKGRMLMVYVEQLSQRLQEEGRSVNVELDLLGRNIEHIRGIVAVQQSYANATVLVEEVSLAQMVDEALRINESLLSQHRVLVDKQFEAGIGAISSQKHKVLQILINLLSNSAQAFTRSDQTERRVVIRLMMMGGERVRLQVADNGEGIPMTNLPSIFTHGFTTRRNGHGFGLHSCFLASMELHGSLSVESPGAGLGATFTLELPASLEHA